jgi:lysyl-tRNA synthetase class 2
MDRTHNPEFTMLEFYRAFADVWDMLGFTERLIGGAVEAVCGSPRVEYQGEAVDFSPPWPRVSILEAVSEKTGERVHDLDPARLTRLAKRHGIETRPGTGAGGLLDALFGELVQPHLRRPTFVLDFPIEISPLARVHRENPAVVERFEVVAQGMELANAFSEQNDPAAQSRAFEEQMARRAGGDEEAQVMDHDYVRALEYGMPPTGGVGIGLDRLVMLITDSRSIRDVILFPQLRPEEGRLDPDEEGAVETDPAASASEPPPR